MVETYRIRCSDLFNFVYKDLLRVSGAASLEDVWVVWDNNTPDRGLSAQLCTFHQTTAADLKTMAKRLREAVMEVTLRNAEATGRKENLAFEKELTSLVNYLAKQVGPQKAVETLKKLVGKEEDHG